MNFKQIGSSSFLFFICMFIAWTPLGVPGATEDDEGKAAYPPEFRDSAYNVMVGEIVAVTRPRGDINSHFQFKVIGDMRAEVKAGTIVSVRGPADPIGGGSYTDSAKIEVGLTSVFLMKKPKLAGGDQFYYVRAKEFPFGVDEDDPTIPSEDAPLVAAALKELGNNLRAPDGVGMSKERARILLGDKNPYLWAMACTRLIRNADSDDLTLLKRQFGSDRLSVAQLLFLDDILDRVTGPADGSKPTRDERIATLRSVLMKYAKAKIPLPPPPTAAEK